VPANRKYRPYSQFPTDGEYVVTRPKLIIGGVTLRYGDPLPKDSPVRSMPYRLATLCRIRHLAYQGVGSTPSVAATSNSAATVPGHAIEEDKTVKVLISEDELNEMSVKELVETCKRLGVRHVGNRSQLRKRIRDYLG